MNVIAFAIEASKLAILAVILYYVVEVLTMPPAPKKAVQMLIILIAILAAIQMVLAGSGVRQSYRSLLDGPNIIAPEK